jgi:[ribosomal protein S18]-alanine N-acetyltransferase
MNPPEPILQIRRMTPADLDNVIEIERSLAQAPHWPLAAWLTALDPQRTPHRIALVAVDHIRNHTEPDATGPDTNIILGFAVAGLLPPQAELETIAVAAKAQRQGIARRVFAEILLHLRAAQVTEVLAEVRISNESALALYGTLGFVETGRRLGYYTDPAEDAVLLTLQAT